MFLVFYVLLSDSVNESLADLLVSLTNGYGIKELKVYLPDEYSPNWTEQCADNVTTAELTPREVKYFRRHILASIEQDTSTASGSPDVSAGVCLHIKQRWRQPDASYIWMYWVPVIVIGCSLFFMLAGIFIFATDNYADDPKNANIFATEGQKVVTGK